MSAPVARRPGDLEWVGNPLGGQITVLLRGEETGGTLTALETVVGAGAGPPLHTHTNEDETVYVLEGEIRFRLGEELTTCGPGSFVFIPRALPHTWQALGPVRFVIHFRPAGMERFFEAFGALEAPGPEDFARLGAERGMPVLGPPLAISHPL